jgi:hypothetical protein
MYPSFFHELFADSSSKVVAKLANSAGWSEEGGSEVNSCSICWMDCMKFMTISIFKVALEELYISL